MFNRRLNDECIARFDEAVGGKRVLLVGNSASLFSDPRHGEIIDSYDFVVRFGKGIPTAENAAYVGTKTDAWFFGPGRAGQWRRWKQVPWKLYTPSQMRVYDKEEDLLIHRDMYNGALQVYEDFFITHTPRDIAALNQVVNKEQSSKSRCSQGIQCIDFFDRVLKVPVTLIGFDFFGKEFVYNFDNAKHPTIPQRQPTQSWHCPLVSDMYTFNPHALSLDGVMSNEERYIRSLGRVNVIEMPDIDEDRMLAIAHSTRGIIK